ncbi:putative reverse transcriptase domain-containing protein [Tanacetum coccineum]|uniref:Reverse transcriptase domain-containing protein n=1 Tax=Tanacetum coccineum TaxID=301880 RepID=A0ABQ5APP6_9ASTR
MWAKVGEGQLIGPELVQETTEKISQIKDRLKAARESSRKDMPDKKEASKFSVGDMSLLNSVLLERCVRFGKKGKLAPRFVRPFEIIEKKCLADPTLKVPLDEIRVYAKLNFVEEPVEILEREFKKLKRSRIAIVKVRLPSVVRLLERMGTPTQVCVWSCPNFSAPAGRPFSSNSPGVVTKMKQIIVMIIEKTELLNHELVDLIVTSVRKENKIALPVCWQLGREVLKRCATQLKPHLPKKVAEEVCSPLMETIPSTTDMSKLREEASRKRKLECLDGSRSIPVAWTNERPLENKELNAIIGAWFTLWRD